MDRDVKRAEAGEASSGDALQDIKLIGKTSPGVQRMEAISKHITFKDRILLFITIFVLAYAYTLDNTLRYTFQTYATASYGQHSLLATVAVIRGVAAAAGQPTAAKIADVFGRVELLILSVVFYIAGTVLETFSNNVREFSAGAVLFQIGWTLMSLLIEIIIADTTSLRSRLFFSFIPNMPYLINSWISGNIAARIVDPLNDPTGAGAGSSIGWRWGIGMWAIIVPVLTIPLVGALFMAHRRAKKHEDLSSYRTPYQMLGPLKLAVALFWQLDVISIILIVAALGCLLVPFTLTDNSFAGGQQSWVQVHILLPLILGVLLFPVFLWWQTKSPHPMVPFKLVKDRAVWGPLCLALFINFSWYLQGDYLYAISTIAFGQSVLSAQRIGTLFNFCSTITGVICGLVVLKVRRLKPFIFIGSILYLISFGLLIRFRSNESGGVSGLIGAQVLLGIGGGLFPYPALASIQSATQHEHVASVTALYLALYNVGGSFGGAVSGAIWTNTLQDAMFTALSEISNNATEITAAMYANPYVTVVEYPIGTPERSAIIDGYRHSQKLLTITGLCLCLPIIFFGLCTRNPRLPDTQSIATAEMSDENLVADDRGNITRVECVGVGDRGSKSWGRKVVDFLLK